MNLYLLESNVILITNKHSLSVIGASALANRFTLYLYYFIKLYTIDLLFSKSIVIEWLLKFYYRGARSYTVLPFYILSYV